MADHPEAPAARRGAVPLVVVTGFLGAGKTTLVNRLLARRAARDGAGTGKLGVIVNELGEIGIDGALLGGDATRQIELPGGCVCCVLGDELDQTLIDLVDRNPDLEAIVLETTGVAEPLPIAWAVARAPVAQRVRLAAVVTVVDAANFVASRALSASVDAQVRYADVLLVTKSQLRGETRDGADAVAVARDLAPRALVRDATTEDHAAWLESLLADPLVPTTRVTDDLGHVHSADCRHLDSPSAHGIDSVWVEVPEPVDLEELEDQLAELPVNYFRIKGIMCAVTPEGERWVAVHRVGPRVSSEVIEPAERPQGRLVALGPAVETGPLARCVAAAVA
jgi:G3E family GTPase